MEFQDKNLQSLKYLVLQALVLGGIFILFWFTLSIGNHSMLESRANTRQQNKDQLIAGIDSIPRVLEAQASFNRLKRSLDSQRKYADSQLEMLKKLNEQEQKYITWPSKYMAVKANADAAESEALSNLNKIRQEEAERINQSQASVEASVLGGFLDQHPSVVLSTLALLFAGLYFVPTFSRLQKAGLATLSFGCEIVAGLIFGLGFYQGYIKNPALVYSATVVTGVGVCGAYGALWQVFRFLVGLYTQALSVAPTPKIERNLAIVEPKVEAPKQEIKIESVMGKSANDLTLDEWIAKAVMTPGKVSQADICRRFNEKPYFISRLVNRTIKSVNGNRHDYEKLLATARDIVARSANSHNDL